MAKPKYKSFPKKLQKQMAEELKAAADTIREKYGLNSATIYSHGNPVSFGIGIWCKANDGHDLIASALASRTEADIAAEQIFLANASFPHDLIGKKLRMSYNKHYVITSVDSNSTKNRWIGIRPEDGYVRTFPDTSLKIAMHTMKPYSK